MTWGRHSLQCDQGLEEFAQGSCVCSISGSVQGQVAWSFGQSHPTDVLAHGRVFGLDDL